MAGNKRTFVNNSIKEDIVRDYFDNKLTISDLKRKYRVAYNTVDNIVKTTSYGFWNNVVQGREIKQVVTETRKYLTAAERSRLMTEDVRKTLSLSIQKLIEILEDPHSSLSITQLVSPYVLDKKVKGIEEDSSRADILRMFKDTLNGKN